MPRAGGLLLVCAALCVVAAVSAAGPRCDAEARGPKEPDGDDNVSLMALRFTTKSVGKTRITEELAAADSLTQADNHTILSAPAADVAKVANAETGGGAGVSTAVSREDVEMADAPAHRGRIPLPYALMTSLASGFAVIFVGCNDIIWFFPFAMHSRRWEFVALYMVMKEFWVLFSWFVVAFGHRLEDLYPGVPVEHVLVVASPALLALYAFVLFLEWYHDVNDPFIVQPGGAQDDALEATSAPPESPSKPKQHSELPNAAGCEQRLDLAKLGALCIIGNLDNLAVFVPGLEAGIFKGPPLAIGTFFAGVFVVAACVGASQLRSIARVAEAVPLWSILAVLALWYTIRLLFGVGQPSALF